MNGQHKDIDIVIYGDGFRPNVGIVICNQFGQVLWARRIGQNSWQFPQGGIKSGESPIQAMYRELNEELGLLKADVKIMMMKANTNRIISIGTAIVPKNFLTSFS